MMKKHALILVLLGMMFHSYGQPVVSAPSFPSTVNLFDLFEVSFTLGSNYTNPYNPDTILIYALFIAPDNTTFKVDAFYYEDYSFQKIIVGNDYYEKASDSPNYVGWKIRFTPTIIGNWRFRIIAEDTHGIATMPNNGLRNYNFVCNPINNAKGFITKANSRYLKRDVVKNGQRQYESYYPIGPNIAWYSCRDYGSWTKPRGIYDYERYIDSLDGNANYMRIWLNRYQYLSLYGPEYTQTENNMPKVYFDSIINQKDSCELDRIISYASQHGVAVMPCIFSFGDFKWHNIQDPQDPSIWKNNPYYTILGLGNACDFFTNADAKKITKNLLRYIVSRWGYATNIICWELWNEVSNMFGMCDGYKHIEQDAQEWHEEMYSYMTTTDPFHRFITTSTGGINNYHYLYSTVFCNSGLVQQHNYQNIQKAKSKEQISYILYKKSTEGHVDYPSRPFFMGEFGFGQNNSSPSYSEKDPQGIDLHNSLWSSLFSTSIGPASFWGWQYIKSQGLFKRFTPLVHFCENLPILSETFTPYQTGTEEGYKLVFPNNIQTYYMINATEDTIMGWSQDTAFAYQSLRWLTDSVRMHSDSTGGALHFVNNAVFDQEGYVYTLDTQKRPQPSSDNNTITIPISSQSVGTKYYIRWHNSETGYPYNTQNTPPNIIEVQQDSSGNKYLAFAFPSCIRDIQQHVINNTFGDAVFFINKRR